MDKRRWLLSLVLGLITVLAVDYFFVHFIFPVKREAILHKLQERVEEEILKNPGGPMPDVPNPGAPKEVPTPQNENSAD